VRAIALLAVLLVLAGCGRGEGEGAAPADPVVPVHADVVTTRMFRETVEAPGRWKGVSEIVVRAPAAGWVEALDPRTGDRVGAGQVVGRVVTRESKAALEGAELLVREAATAAARAEAGRALALARRELVRVPLVAARAGIVVRRGAEPGALADEGGELLALVPTDGLVFEAHVPPALAARVRPGQAATVEVEAAAPRLATVKSVLPQADSTDQSTLVWLVPSAPTPLPALDRFGTVRIVTGAPHASSAVPEAAVVEDDLTGEPEIAVVDSGGRAAWTHVKVGTLEGGWREVLAPRLAPGTRVVIEGQHGLPDRAQVEVAK